ncbi:MAG: PhoU domain-containing protein, partial [Bacteroidales bacterium]
MKTQTEITIETLNEDFKVFSTMLLKQFHLTNSLFEADHAHRMETMKTIMDHEHIVDGLEVKMREEIVRSIVLYCPRAGDLRKIMAYYDLSSYLERIGDLLMNVAEFIGDLHSEKKEILLFRRNLKEFLELSENMVQNAIFAFSCEDSLLAKETIRRDDSADTLHSKIITGLKNEINFPIQAEELTD